MINEHEDWEEALVRARLLRNCLEMPNEPHYLRMQKWDGLKACGLSDAEVERLCEPKELTQQERYQLLAEHCEEERRDLDKWNREQKRARRRKAEAECHNVPDLGPDFWNEPPDSTLLALREQKERMDKEAALNNKMSVKAD